MCFYPRSIGSLVFQCLCQHLTLRSTQVRQLWWADVGKTFKMVVVIMCRMIFRASTVVRLFGNRWCHHGKRRRRVFDDVGWQFAFGCGPAQP